MRAFVRLIIAIVNVIVAFIMTTACTEELDFEYDSVAPMINIEAKVSASGSRVVVTTSRDVTDPSHDHYVDDAQISLLCPDGKSILLQPAGNGEYVADGIDAFEGGVYAFSAQIGEQTFVAFDTMGIAPQNIKYDFIWEKVMGMDYVSLRYGLTVPSDSLSFYMTQVYRNGAPYKWEVFNSYTRDEDMKIKGRCICFSTDDVEGKENSRPQDVIHDGDLVEIYISGISRRTYDYMAALANSGSTCANPKWQYSGGDALGFFSALGEVKLAPITFNIKNVGTEWDY